jgi:hypothetical protein
MIIPTQWGFSFYQALVCLTVQLILQFLEINALAIGVTGVDLSLCILTEDKQA